MGVQAGQVILATRGAAKRIHATQTHTCGRLLGIRCSSCSRLLLLHGSCLLEKSLSGSQAYPIACP